MSAAYASLAAADIVRMVAAGEVSATAIAEAALARIAAANPKINAFTDVTAARALASAAAVDAARARGAALGPLAGVPYAVKNLFDIKGLPTRAGAKINRANPPAAADATLVAKLDAAGAVLLGGLNMGEFAYDFTGENLHDGAARNPHDPAHMTGGSSSGSGAAVAAGMVPLALGSDTNGSIRVPAALCGLFGLKPTYGRLSRGGSFPFVASLDHLGPLGRSPRDLALAYDAMQGPDARDPAQAARAAEPVSHLLDQGIGGLRIARLGGYFAQGLTAEGAAAMDHVAQALGATSKVELPEAARARAAAFLITMAEGAALHLERLRRQPEDFDPAVRDRLMAGAMLPAPWIVLAQKFRRWFQQQARELFRHADVLLAPVTPGVAPRIGQTMMVLGGVQMPVRPNLGLFTQPISFIGLPVCAVPVWLGNAPLPLGVQLIAPAWREDLALCAAHALEAMGAVRFKLGAAA